MKKILSILIIIQVSFTAFAADTYFEKNMSFYSPKILSMGNTYVATAKGLESFEYNPAGVAGDKSLTLINGNFNLISNLVQLSDDLVASYNEVYGTNKTTIEYADLAFYLGTENRDKIIGALLAQTRTPYEDNQFANGFGFASSLSLGFVGEGFGIGLLVSLDSEVFGEEGGIPELDNVLTTSLLLGYGMSIDLGIMGLDVGIAARPMYKVRSTSEFEPVREFILADANSPSSADFIRDLDYMTGVGVGFDLGAKAYFMGLSVGVSLIDLFGTSIVYTNTYENIMNGIFLGSEIIEDEYITPTTLKVGVSLNPGLGAFSKVFNPTISADYNVLFIDEGSIEDYAVAGSFWNSLSLGAEVELFSFINLRAGLNQGYLTAGLGLDLFILDINAAVYSRELGEEVGDRQQMGASVEIGIRL